MGKKLTQKTGIGKSIAIDATRRWWTGPEAIFDLLMRGPLTPEAYAETLRRAYDAAGFPPPEKLPAASVEQLRNASIVVHHIVETLLRPTAGAGEHRAIAAMAKQAPKSGSGWQQARIVATCFRGWKDGRTPAEVLAALAGIDSAFATLDESFVKRALGALTESGMSGFYSTAAALVLKADALGSIKSREPSRIANVLRNAWNRHRAAFPAERFSELAPVTNAQRRGVRGLLS